MWKGRDGMLMTVVSNIWDGKNHGLLFQRGRQDFSPGGKNKIQADGSKTRVFERIRAFVNPRN